MRRDPGDTRVTLALGIRHSSRRALAKRSSVPNAIGRLTVNYTSAKDGEPLDDRGVALAGQARHDEACDGVAKAAWSDTGRGPAYWSLAEIAARRRDFSAALEYLDRSLDANALNLRAVNLKAAVLRHTGRANDALALLDVAARKTDPLDVRLMTECWLAGGKKAGDELTATARSNTGLESAPNMATPAFGLTVSHF